MAAWQLLLEVGLIVLLGATLFHALRLERALGTVRKDRAELETMLRGFNESTRQAETATERLRSAADGAGRHVARQIETAAKLRDDLADLIDQGERVATRMDTLTRVAREPEPYSRRATAPKPDPADLSATRVRSQAERDLLQALRVTR